MKNEFKFEDLEEIDDMPQFKNSLVYESSDWRELSELDVTNPVQRKLTTHECVFDLDHVAPIHFKLIPEYLVANDFKFIAWQSGTSGMHIHFWTNVHGKEPKKKLTEFLAKKIEDRFGVKNDLGPMGHGHIRCEYSFHPTKGYQKILLKRNLSSLFSFNDINPSVMQKVVDLGSTEGQNVGKIAAVNGKIPTCVKYILSHKFADGRERLLFSVVSWYKANGKSEQEIFELSYAWCKKQDYNISTRHIWAKIKSSSGRCGCQWRHSILDELGVDMEKCKYE